jgi:hypothetical protein
VRLPFVSFHSTYRFLADGTMITADSTLRFLAWDEIESSLARHGHRVLDAREAPDGSGRELGFVAQRTN